MVPDFVVQGGDPRGDGEGGPGYTIRDELNQRPYLRGTVGMALDWADTGGSQFFITHSPQPHLDAKYTVFGRVIAGMDVVDQIQQGDVIRRVTNLGWSGRGCKLKKGATAAPFFDGRGQLTVSCRPSSSRPWLSSPLSFIPPFMWVWLARALTIFDSVAAAWHAHPTVGARRFVAPSAVSGPGEPARKGEVDSQPH